MQKVKALNKKVIAIAGVVNILPQERLETPFDATMGGVHSVFSSMNVPEPKNLRRLSEETVRLIGLF